jgi:hypothetical protein
MMNEASDTAVLELLLAEAAEGTGGHRAWPGVMVGTLDGFDETGQPMVRLPETRSGVGLAARSVVVLDDEQIGSDVVLAFDRGDPRRPIVMGVIRPPEAVRAVAQSDPETLSIAATKEIVLRCGKASITLTRAGKILLRGAYLLSRSSGANRIKGGSVQIN